MSCWNLFCTLDAMGTCQCEAGAAGTKLALATPCIRDVSLHSSWGCTWPVIAVHTLWEHNTMKAPACDQITTATEVTGDLQKKEFGAVIGCWLLLAESGI